MIGGTLCLESFLFRSFLGDYMSLSVKHRIAATCFRAQLGLFSPNLIDQSSCRMGQVLACVVRILHDDWSIRLGENKPDEARKHLVAMLSNSNLKVTIEDWHTVSSYLYHDRMNFYVVDILTGASICI